MLKSEIIIGELYEVKLNIGTEIIMIEKVRNDNRCVGKDVDGDGRIFPVRQVVAHVNNGKQYKEIGYSYPTSENAVKFGFDKDGCYTISIGDSLHKPLKTVAGYATFDEAKLVADSLKGEYTPYSFSKNS